MQRELKTKIPSQVINTPFNNDAIVTEADQQSRGKEYADVRRHAKKKNIQPGDYVLVQQRHRNKLPILLFIKTQ